MTAVIYARYSTDSQREESIEGQIRECTAYTEKNGFTVVKHYIDRAISAKTDNRPQFQQMIKDSDKKLFDIVLVWKLDRFARNRYDSARYKTQLKRNGVKLVSATEVISAGPEGIILESVLEGYAEYYSADLSEKVVRGMTENTLKGVYNGGTVPFGYVIDENRHYKPDPLLAPYVEQAFQKYADGATMTDLRDWLKAHNIKNTLGGEMSYNTIQRLLSNRRYIGELRLRDVVQPNAIPALVSEDLFNKVQEKLVKNKKAPARHKAEDTYLMTTKLYCGKCGALMSGESGVSHTGKMYTYYKCAAAKKKKTCDKKAVRKQWLEDLVVSETMKLVEDDASMNAIIAKVMELQNQESTDLPIYEKQLKETEVGIANMLNAIQMGILTSSTKERLAKPKMKEEFVRFWLLRFRKLDMTQPEQRQALVDTFINAIYLYDDKVLITFNYKEGTETVAFGEAVKAEKSSDMSARGAPNKVTAYLIGGGFLLVPNRHEKTSSSTGGDKRALVQERTSSARMEVVWQPRKKKHWRFMSMNDVESLSHSKYRCKYHIVFAPKYRRQIIYKKIKADVGKILRELCERKGVRIVEAECCPDSYSHAGRDTTAYEGSEFHGISKE